MAASVDHPHSFAQTAAGLVCTVCGATLSQAEISANKVDGMNLVVMYQYIHKKQKG